MLKWGGLKDVLRKFHYKTKKMQPKKGYRKGRGWMRGEERRRLSF